MGFSAETPELSNEQRNVFFDLQGLNARILIEPEEGSSEVLKVDTDLDNKSQAQRIRAILYVYWKQAGEKGEFKDFYHRATEKYINEIKGHLE